MATRRGLECAAAGSEFFVTQGGCSCDLVQPQGRSMRAVDTVRDLARQTEVKAVEVLWSFHSGAVGAAPAGRAERLTVAEFESRNAANDLRPDVWYRVLDSSKWHSGEQPIGVG